MAIETNTGFKIGSKASIDDRLVLTKNEMLNASTSTTPDNYFCICKDDGGLYLYNINNTFDNMTGYYQRFTGSSGATIGYWCANTEYHTGDLIINKKPNDYYTDPDTGVQTLVREYYTCIYICNTDHTSTTDFELDIDKWNTIDGTNFEYYDEDEISLMMGLTNEEMETLSSILQDDQILTSHGWSSSKIYNELLNVLNTCKQYTDSSLQSVTGLKKKVVTSVPDPNVDVVDPNTLYLIKDPDSKTGDSYLQYILINGEMVSLGRTSGMLPITLYEVNKTYAYGDLVLYKSSKSLTYNIYRCIKTAGITTTSKFDTTAWQITNGGKLGISANANNTSSNYRLDLTQPDGTVFTTDNLKGIDNVKVQNGFFQVYVENGNAYVIVQNGATPPPLSLEDGKLYYLMGSTIKYTSVQYDVSV